MAHIEITPQTLIVHVASADRLWDLKTHLKIPLAHVVGARQATEEARAWLQASPRHPGWLWGASEATEKAQAWLKSFHLAGPLHHHGDNVFWAVHDPDRAIAIQLTDDHYAHLVIEVTDPAATLAAIAQAVQPHEASQ